MIATLLRIFWLHLRRDRVVWLLTFIVPVVFFSIFAIIFSGQSRSSTPTVHVAVVDEDNSDFSRKLASVMESEKSLEATTRLENGALFTRAGAESLVRDGRVSAAIVLPKGLGQSFPGFSGKGPTVEILADTSDPVAPQMLSGMLQGLAMTAAPDAMIKGGLGQLTKWGGPLTPGQQQAITQAEQFFKQPAAGNGPVGGGATSGLLSVKVVDVLGQTKANPVVAFCAAATAVMFLLFSRANGAGGSLIEEVENGTLDRLLSSNLTMTQLLAGKWISFVMLGMVQITVMFLWGWLVFGLELCSHLAGFLIMTTVTAAAVAAFGVMLGTLCRTRSQLGGVSTTVILLMSAVGGSMFPRFLMSENLQAVGLLTFNAWALDGYQKVFWSDAPIGELWPQLLVLAGLTGGFLVAARTLSRRWEMTYDIVIRNAAIRGKHGTHSPHESRSRKQIESLGRPKANAAGGGPAALNLTLPITH
jgi:ABC-2 type transport system permease protein